MCHLKTAKQIVVSIISPVTIEGQYIVILKPGCVSLRPPASQLLRTPNDSEMTSLPPPDWDSCDASSVAVPSFASKNKLKGWPFFLGQFWSVTYRAPFKGAHGKTMVFT